MDGNRAVVAASAVGDPRSGVALVRHLKTTKACHYVLMFVTGKGRGTIIQNGKSAPFSVLILN